MKKTILTCFVFCALINSCTNEQKSEKQALTKSNENKLVVNANQFIEFELKGMVCKMGCGSTIKKALLGTNAIATCEIDYSETRETNFVKIGYDNRRISTKKLKSIIEALNEMQFKIIDTTEKEQQTIKNSSSFRKSKSKVLEQLPPIEETNVELPNLIDIYSRLVTS
jgi:copper chaperone CopZ